MSEEPQVETHLLPDVLPKPTYMPAVLALGICLLVWGIITSPLIIGAGGVLMVAGVAGWIGDMTHEEREPDPHVP